MSSEKKPRIFICWSGADADAALKDRLVQQLKVLEHEGELRVWHDDEIPAGANRVAIIKTELDAAAVAVFLISADALSTPIVRDVHIRRLLERCRDDGLHIVPVLARACAWQRVAWLASLQQRPGDGRALAAGTDDQIDTDLAVIADEIADLIAQSPRYANAETATLARALADLYRRRDDATAAGDEAERAALTAHIIDHKRKLREAGHLQAGDFLANGRYQLTERIGMGGFATVWKAYDRRARRFVAIKVLHADQAQDRSRRERFLRGAREMAALDHPGIVRVFEPEGEDGGWHYFVMEYVAGEDLNKAVLNGRVNPEDIASLFISVADALEHAHERDLVHRDVKPANVLLDAHRCPRLTDFDLVRAGETSGGTRTGMMGTFLYAAPEVMSRPQEADARADVFSLGMTAVFLYSGRSLDHTVLYDQRNYIQRLQCTAAIKTVLLRAVKPQAAERYDSIKALRTAFQLATAGPEKPQPRAAPRTERLVADALSDALSDAARDDLARHADWIERASRAPLDVMAGVDPLDLAQAGWGVVFAQGADPSVREALQPLIEHRREQAGARFREYSGRHGYQPGDDKWAFLERLGVGPGPVDPRQVPYYLLLVGAPTQIPFAFQCQLDLQYAVGRLDFATPKEYRRYAEAVVAVEQGRAARPRRVAVFGPRNVSDPMAALAHDHLSKPLAGALMAEAGWRVERVLGAEAKRARLAALLGAEAPALLFTAGHGVVAGMQSTNQRQLQGAIVCQDWRHGEQLASLRREHFFCADDLSATADLRGLVVFSLGPFSAGTPRFDSFPSLRTRSPREIAHEEFVAALPQRLLSNPGGPALAVVGHVDSIYEYSFKWLPHGGQWQTLSTALRLLMHGVPVGRAMECFSQRYAEIACDLSELQATERLGFAPDKARVERLWQASRDARGYVLLGDPAVRVGAEPAPPATA